MDSFNLSLSEDEDLQDNLLRIVNGTDDSDLDSSNTPTEALDETEQGQGKGANPNIEPIIISDESDSEDDSTVIATISLKRGPGHVEVNRYVSASGGTFI